MLKDVQYSRIGNKAQGIKTERERESKTGKLCILDKDDIRTSAKSFQNVQIQMFEHFFVSTLFHSSPSSIKNIKHIQKQVNN